MLHRTFDQFLEEPFIFQPNTKMMFDLSGLYGKGTAIKHKMINHNDERRNAYEKVDT